MKAKLKVAVIGATGQVGRKMLELLESRAFPVGQLIPAASQGSVGHTLNFGGRPHRICSVQDALDMKPDLALFSAGSAVSMEWAKAFAEHGLVVDNSSAWRMTDGVPLVVPEVNPNAAMKHQGLIANPNCSTIQLVVALAPLHREYQLRRLIISTYQSVSGSGVRAMRQLQSEREGKASEKAYPHVIDGNCIPHCDIFLDDGYTKEEHKLRFETRKILENEHIAVSATAVRVPVEISHSESVHAAFHRKPALPDVRRLLTSAPGLRLIDEPLASQYPMPRQAAGSDDVYVGRIRLDEGDDHALNLWVVADNLRKGAATNAIQIAELVLLRQGKEVNAPAVGLEPTT